MRRYREYDPFAWLYTNHWGDEFHRQIMPVLEKLLLSHLPKRAKILDLCCGDGRVSYQLFRRGYNVTGLDGSEQMLAFAKQRAPKIEFLLQDARHFRLPCNYDAAISTFDSLNHIPRTEELRSVFRNVHSCLKPDGTFVFDLNREEAYLDFWARTSTTVDAEAVSIAQGSYDPVDRTAACDVTLFRLVDRTWQRSDYRLTQHYYPEDVVVSTLREAGFEATVFDGSRDLQMKGDIGVGRNFFVARKDGAQSTHRSIHTRAKTPR